MDPGTIFFKTDKGRTEVAERSGQLSPVQRRLLIVIDGKKTVNDLGALVRSDELLPALDHLLGLGLTEAPGVPVPMVAPVATGFAASMPGELPRAATSVEHFTEVRQRASNFVRERLGKPGEPICTAIDRCASPEELRKMLRGVEIFVQQRLDAETTQAFARHFGQLLL
jgi:hypothetical protein